jgi:cytochrome c5
MKLSMFFALLWAAMSVGSAKAEPASPNEKQFALFANNCVQCHARPGVGAPLVGNPVEWKERIARGEEAMLRNVVEGIRGMPPLGYCSACSEADFRVLTRFMAGIE